MFVSIYYKPSLFNAHTMILIVHIFKNVNKLCLNHMRSVRDQVWTVLLSRTGKTAGVSAPEDTAIKPEWGKRTRVVNSNVGQTEEESGVK